MTWTTARWSPLTRALAQVERAFRAFNTDLDIRPIRHRAAARAALEEEIFGKHVLITDHDDWPAAEVIAAYRSESEAEFSFRQMKDPHAVSFSPMFH